MGVGTIAAFAVPVIAYLLTSKKSAASSGGVKSPTSKPPAQRMAEVIATGDPAAIRFEAGRLRQEGYPAEAAELDRVAGIIAAQGGAAPVVTPTPMPTPVAVPPVTPTGPNAPTLPGVPANLQGVTLRETKPIAYDARTVTLQQRLIELGWPLTADGKFGPGTTAAVKEFQKLNGVAPVDGIVGPITLIKLADPGAKHRPSVAAPTVKPAAPKPAAPKPAPLPTPAATLPAAAPASSAGRAPTITAALRSLSTFLKNGKATGYKAPASSGPAVVDWQQVLFDLGFIKTKPDGKFGDGTEAATRAFQTAANTAAAKSGKPKLSVDGIVGPATIARAAEARIMPTGAATFAGAWFGDDVMYAPSSPQPDSPLPGIIPDMAPVAPDPRRALAARLTHMLLSAPRGGEDRTLVALYQAQQGLRPTGFYGPAVALSLAQSFGIVPPKPLYWTESRTSKSKSNYRDALRMFGERDPQRVEEWNRAGAV